MARQPIIDALEFARAGESLQGTCAVADLPRLRDVLLEDSGALEYELLGQRDGQGQPVLRLRIRGALQLVCQRCLEAMVLPVNIDTTLGLAGSQAEIDGEPLTVDSPERIAASKRLAVHELIEEELLLTVPYAPRHAQCELREQKGSDAKESPFADLGALVGSRGIRRGRRGGKRSH